MEGMTICGSGLSKLTTSFPPVRQVKLPSSNGPSRIPENYSESTTNRDENLMIKNTYFEVRTPVSMTRAKVWTPEVENIFRFQQAGFRDFEEYYGHYNTEVELWPSCGFVKCLKAKKTGYFLYFRQYRECEERYLKQIKIFSY